jgi:hypothetical protein
MALVRIDKISFRDGGVELIQVVGNSTECIPLVTAVE